MNEQQQNWKRAADELWSAQSLDYNKAARLVAEIAQQNEGGFLQQAAAQALPSLRSAAARTADRMAKARAQQRLGAVRDALHALSRPRFGRRRDPSEPSDPDEDHRRMLGLPLGRRLYGPEIKDAYKRAAKRAHPDGGGSEQAFRALRDAHDALMKEL